MKALLTFAFVIILNSSFGQQYDSTSTGEIPISSLTHDEELNFNSTLEQYRTGIAAGTHCYFVFDDSGTYCRTSGTVTDYNVLGRRWGVIYNCSTGSIIMVWEI
ncbi:MAG TPA: hypothetical protein PK504_00510 [Ferruginibacter sp.]|nr:hypothetical protein [Ferruginibacter sp.]HRE62345.1 hypothetical protein [Ferruginibacter sp.]